MAATVYFLAAYLARSWASVKDYDWTLRPGWLALSAVAFLLFYLMQAVFWWLLLRGFALSSPFPVAAATWAKSILARYIPGNVFMYLSRAWLSHAQGLPVDRVTAAMVYEQALGVCSALITMALLFPFWEYRPGVTALSLIAIPVLIALLHPRVFAPLSAWVLRVLRRPPLDVTLGFGGGAAPAGLLRGQLVRGRRGRLAPGARRHRSDRRRAAARRRRQRPRLRGGHGRVRLSQRHRRARGGVHGVSREAAPRRRRPCLGAAAARVGDGHRTGLRGPGRGGRGVPAPQEGRGVSGRRDKAARKQAAAGTAAAGQRAARPFALAPIAELDDAERSRLFRRNAAYVIGGAVLFAAIYALLSWLKYRAYMDARFDLGNMVQAVFNTAHGRFLEITTGELKPRQMSRLGSHVDPILALFALPWLVWPSPVMLLVAAVRHRRHRRLACVSSGHAGHA